MPKKTIPYHPLLFAVYPLLLLYVSNRGVILWDQTVHGIAVSLGLALAGYGLLFLITRRAALAALLTALFILYFFTYGELIEEVDTDAWGLSIGIGLYIFLAVVAWKKRERLCGLTSWLNIVSVAMVALVSIQILAAPVSRAPGPTGEYPALKGLNWPEAPEVRPNIYYLVFDAYARADVLQELYAFDNSAMLAYLKKQGFFLAEKARSNYCQSILSLASSLNMIHLDQVAKEAGQESQDHSPLCAMARDNAVFAFLRHYGYEIIGFDAAGWEPVEIETTDVFYPTPGRGMDSVGTALANSTLLGAWRRWRNQGTETSDHALHRLRLTHALDKLEALPATRRGPFMAYAHLLLPHQPFVFDAEGNPANETQKFSIWHTTDRGRDPEEYRRNYVAQLQYANGRIQSVVDQVLIHDPNAIIILQADHGPALQLHTRNASQSNFKERLSIMNAYYTQGKNLDIPMNMTPVNTFRMIFNHYFGTNFDLLSQNSYFSTWNRPYRFIPYDPTGKISENPNKKR